MLFFFFLLRFIDILKLLVKSIGSSEENFFPDIVSFALKQLYPALKHVSIIGNYIIIMLIIIKVSNYYIYAFIRFCILERCT